MVETKLWLYGSDGCTQGLILPSLLCALAAVGARTEGAAQTRVLATVPLPHSQERPVISVSVRGRGRWQGWQI